jgi:Bacterial RNA polymerase, alpha chain C terminal domain
MRIRNPNVKEAKMSVPVETIVSAAKTLQVSNLRKRITEVCGDNLEEVHRIPPVIFPYIHHLLTLVDAAEQIAQCFQLRMVVRAEEGVTLPPGFELNSPLFGPEGILEEESERCKGCLKTEGIHTVRDLKENIRGVMHIPGFGRKTLGEVKQRLIKKGFRPDEFRCLVKPQQYF